MKKLFFWIIIAVLAWLGVVGVSYAFRHVLIAPYLNHYMVAAAKRELGVDLAIKRIGGNYISELEIDQVRTLHSNPAGPVVSLKIDRLRLRYSLPTLFLGKKLFINKSTLELQGARVEINLKNQSAAKHPSLSSLDRKNFAFSMPVLPALPRMLLQDTVLSFEMPFLNIPELRLESHLEGEKNNLIHVVADKIELKSPSHRQQRLSLEADIAYSPAEISCKRLRLSQKSVSGSNQLAFQAVSIPMIPLLQGQWDQVLKSSRGKFTAQLRDIPSLFGVAYQPKQKFPQHSLLLQGEVQKGKLQTQYGVLEMPQGKIQLDRFSAGMESLASSWLELPFDAEVTLQAGDLAPWATLLGIPGIKGAWDVHLAGQGRLADFKANVRASCTDFSYQPTESDEIFFRAGKLELQTLIQGSVQQPKFTGQFSLEDGQIKLSEQVPVIRDIQLKSALDSSQANIQTLTARVSGSPLSVSGTIEDIFTLQPKLNLRLQGSNLLVYRSEDVRVRADAAVMVSGPLDKIKVIGEGRITNGLYNRDINFLGFLKPNGRPQAKPGLILFSFTAPPFNHLQLGIKITSADTFLIKNNAATGSVRPELFLGGTGEVPVLTGTVYIGPTLISLPTGILTIQSGVVSFLENSPDIPRLDILAQTKMQGYDITLRVAGPYDEPVVTLSSVPPAPNDQLLLLVLTGQSPQPLSGQRFVSTGNIALYVGQGVVGRILSKTDRRFLERLQMNIGRNISRNGNDTLEAQFQITKNWLTTRDVVYLTSERDVYDDYNAGAKIVFQFK